MRSSNNVKATTKTAGHAIAAAMMGLSLLALVLAGLLFLYFQALSLSHRYSLDYGEPVMFDQALALLHGLPLYRPNMDTPPYTISNYPPVYVLVLAGMVKVFGPALWTGRIISTVSALASAVFLGLTVRALAGGGKDRQTLAAALMTGLAFLSIPYVVQWSALARIDLLALALATGALWLLAQWPNRRWSFLTGGLLLVGAIYTRQSYALAAPFAAFVWLWSAVSWRRAFVLAFFVGGVTAALFLLINALSQGGFFYNLVTATNNAFSWERVDWNLDDFRRMLPVFSLLAGLAVLLLPGLAAFGDRLDEKLPSRRNAWALAATFVLGGFLSALTIGKIGSNINYFLELCAALALAFGLLLVWSERFPWLRVLLLAAAVFQVVHSAGITVDEKLSELEGRRAAAGQLQELEALVSSAGGTVLADEYSDMITRQGKTLYIQPFSATQLANQGMWNQEPFLEQIRSKEFSLILIHYFPQWPVYKERWTPEMLTAVRMNYNKYKMFGDTLVYRPKPAR